MNQVGQSSVTIYSIFKDIIIPSLSLISTIVIGTVIAISLKKREEKTKIKALLIDTYMEYLNKIIAFVLSETNGFAIQTLRVLHNNYEQYFGVNANSHIPQKIIEKRIKQLKDKEAQVNQDAINWSVYTYKFCFLLGKKKYDRYLQPLEDVISKEFFGNSGRQAFVDETMKKIISDKIQYHPLNF